MNEKTKKILKIIYVVLCIGGGIGALSTGLRGILAAPFLIAAGLVAIPKVSAAVPFFKSNKAATIACSAVLLVAGGLILPKQQTPERKEQEPQSRSVPIVTEADTTEPSTETTTTTTQTETTTTTKETTTTTTKETTVTTKATTTTAVKTTALKQTRVVTTNKTKTDAPYVINTSKHTIHKSDCTYVEQIDSNNRLDFYGTLDEAKAQNSENHCCGRCLKGK